MTFIFFAINILVYVAMLLIFGTTESTRALVMAGANNRLLIVNNHEWWRFLTSGFIHIGFEHILMNMLALYFLGSELEPFLGRWRFAIIYLASIIGGSLFSFGLEVPGVVSAGASSGIFGLFATYLVLGRRYQSTPVIRQRAQMYTILMVFNFVTSLFSRNIDFWGHFGGVIYGIIFAFLVGDLYSKHPNSKIQGIVLMGVALGISVILIKLGIYKGF